MHFADRITPRQWRLHSPCYAGAVALSLPGGARTVACLRTSCSAAASVPRIAVAAATLGATLVFLAARYLFADAARKRLGGAGERINAGFTRHAFSYLLFLRLVPLFPFFLVNLAPAFTSIPVSTYVLATLIGIIPATFVYVNLGEALGHLDSLQGALSFNTLGALALLGLLALVPGVRPQAQPARGAAHANQGVMKTVSRVKRVRTRLFVGAIGQDNATSRARN